MIWVAVSASVIIAFGAFVLASLPGRKPGSRGFRLIVLTVVFVAAVASAVSSVVAHNREKQLELEFEREMRARSETTLSAVTGGDSYCSISFAKPITDVARLAIVNRGDHPLYDVTARVVDLDKFDDVTDEDGSLHFDDMLRFQTILDLGNIPAGLGLMALEDWPIGDGNTKRYNIFFAARNGTWFERVRMVRVGGTWLVAVRVYRGIGDEQELLWEKIDEGYPLSGVTETE